MYPHFKDAKLSCFEWQQRTRASDSNGKTFISHVFASISDALLCIGRSIGDNRKSFDVLRAVRREVSRFLYPSVGTKRSSGGMRDDPKYQALGRILAMPTIGIEGEEVRVMHHRLLPSKRPRPAASARRAAYVGNARARIRRPRSGAQGGSSSVDGIEWDRTTAEVAGVVRKRGSKRKPAVATSSATFRRVSRSVPVLPARACLPARASSQSQTTAASSVSVGLSRKRRSSGSDEEASPQEAHTFALSRPSPASSRYSTRWSGGPSGSSSIFLRCALCDVRSSVGSSAGSSLGSSGRFLPAGVGVWVHPLCALICAVGTSPEAAGGHPAGAAAGESTLRWLDIAPALKGAKELLCSHCGHEGAVVRCRSQHGGSSCSYATHVGCAHNAGMRCDAEENTFCRHHARSAGATFTLKSTNHERRIAILPVTDLPSSSFSTSDLSTDLASTSPSPVVLRCGALTVVSCGAASKQSAEATPITPSVETIEIDGNEESAEAPLLIPYGYRACRWA